MLATLVAGLLCVSPDVRYFVQDGGVVSLMAGVAEPVELSRFPHGCPISRVVWAEDAGRVLVAGPCQAVVVSPGGARPIAVSMPPLGERPVFEFATDGTVLGFTEGMKDNAPTTTPPPELTQAVAKLASPVHAWLWGRGGWRWLESGERAVGLESLEGVLYSDLTTAKKRLRARGGTLWPIIPPGGVANEPLRRATATDTLPGPDFSLSKDGRWAWRTSGTDACAVEPPVLVREEARWKTVVAVPTVRDPRDCVRVQRVRSALLLDPSWAAPIVVDLDTATSRALPEDALGASLVGTPNVQP